MGTDSEGEPTFRCERGRNIHAGSRFFANADCVMFDGAPITMGDDVPLGSKVSPYSSNHALDTHERAVGNWLTRPITVGNGV